MTSLQQLNIESFKEGNRFEAKLAKGGVPASLWETYASFADTDGGLILLGVKENKNHTFAIEGIDNPEQIFMFTRRGCSHFPRCRSSYTGQQVDCRS
ncbi:MAG: hypothetical protein J6T96_16045 [Bacteroidales bacterium]|nr:hypothetical protein [Bacteroidales bacterium]